jgi:hypothetical protein
MTKIIHRRVKKRGWVDIANITHNPTVRNSMIGYERITKGDFYLNGGFANSRCVRITRNRRWMYFWRMTA